MIVALYRSVGAVLKQHGFESDLVGDEGGFGPRLRSNEQAFDIVVEAILACGFEPRREVAIAVDVASTHFFDPVRGVYRLHSTGERVLDSQGVIDLLADWVEQYPIISIEDGLAEDDWDGWAAMTSRFDGSVQLIGDDLFATQVVRLKQGIERNAGNAVLIKLNQVGTLTETLDALELARTRLSHSRVSAFGRDRGYDNRRPGRCHCRRADQDRLGSAFGTAGEIQSSVANRRTPRPESAIRPLHVQAMIHPNATCDHLM